MSSNMNKVKADMIYSKLINLYVKLVVYNISFKIRINLYTP